jgi:hypothetical protein
VTGAGEVRYSLGHWLVDRCLEFVAGRAARPGRGTGRLSVSTCRKRMRTLRMFFKRIIEWDWPDAAAAAGSWRRVRE